LAANSSLEWKIGRNIRFAKLLFGDFADRRPARRRHGNRLWNKSRFRRRPKNPGSASAAGVHPGGDYLKSLEVLKPEQRALHDGRHQADLLRRQVNAAQSVRTSAMGSCMLF
jgi:hypothetical protein